MPLAIPERGHTAHKSYKALGYVDDLIRSRVQDSAAFYKQEVSELNRQRNDCS